MTFRLLTSPLASTLLLRRLNGLLMQPMLKLKLREWHWCCQVNGLFQRIHSNDHFTKDKKMVINLKYIDPTYMIRAIPSNALDNMYCTLLAHSAIHGATAGYTGFTVGPVNGRHAYIPFYRVIERQNKVVITDRMWARVLSSTNQPSFLDPRRISEANKDEPQP